MFGGWSGDDIGHDALVIIRIWQQRGQLVLARALAVGLRRQVRIFNHGCTQRTQIVPDAMFQSGQAALPRRPGYLRSSACICG